MKAYERLFDEILRIAHTRGVKFGRLQVVDSVHLVADVLDVLMTMMGTSIRLNSYRTQKKNKNKQGWVKLKESAEYQEGLKERYKVERKFSEAKK